MMPTTTGENYLKSVWLLADAGDGMTTVSALAAALGVTRGTVTTMSKSLAAQGLLVHLPREGVGLTPEGRAVALKVLRKHRLVEAFLVQVLKMDWADVHQEAETLEHAVSDRVLEKIDGLLGHPSVDPHGDPIPNAKGHIDRASERTTLITCPPQKAMQVVRIGDQTPEFLEFVQKIGLKPGSKVQVARRDKPSGVVHCSLEANREAVLGFPEAAKIEVRLAS